jgi:hypothetical protein
MPFDADAERGRAAEDRQDLALVHTGHEALEDLRLRELTLLEVLLEQGVVALGHGLHEPLACRRRLVGELRGDLSLLALHHRLHAQQVHDAGELLSRADGEGEQGGLGVDLLERLDGCREVGSLPVEPVHECEQGRAGASGAAPHGLGTDLGTVHRRQHQDRAVERGEGDLPVGEEVGVARGIHQREVLAVPVEAVECRAEGGLAFLLLGLGQEHRRAVVDAPQLSGRPGGVEQSLAHRGLPIMGMSYEREVPGVSDRHVLHACLSFRAPSPRAG